MTYGSVSPTAAPGRWRPRDAPRASSAGVLLLVFGVLAHGALWAVFGPVPDMPLAQPLVLLLQAVSATVLWVIRSRSALGLWPAIAVIGTFTVGGVPSTYPQAVLGVISLLFVNVMYASRLLGRNTARLTTASAVLVASWVLLHVGGGRQAIADLLFIGGALVLVHVILVAVTDEQWQLMQTLEHMAREDGLTGALTRSAFDDSLTDSLGRPTSTSLLVIDIDLFKTVNDTHGHPAGDAVLQHVARRLSTAVRSDDAALGRLGGDELAIILQGCSEGTAWRRAQEIVTVVGGDPVLLPDGTPLRISVSIGAAHHPAGTPATDLTAASLYNRADAALYRAKQTGRGRAELATSEM